MVKTLLDSTAAQREPDVFEYVDYRSFLGDWIRAKKFMNPGYSHRVFARRAGYSNPSLLGQIIKGKRNLTEKGLPGFLKALSLKGEEREYFRTLVALDRACTADERTHLVERLAARRRFKGSRRLEDEGFRYLSRWYFPAIRELAARDDFRLDAEWVARRLKPKITVAKVNEALEALVASGMIEATGDGGAEQTEKNVVTAHEVASLAVRNYHRGMTELALAALEEKGGPERHFGAVTALAPASLIPTLKREIAAFQERIMNLCDESSDPGEIAIQLNLQLFPLSETEEDSS
jgi:uncharacterized protein (TIGR02147 family)